jgi:4-hydroxy-3-polyprenylbenzoate decarboxylase
MYPNWTHDLHFQTKTTIDTLDYSGDGWNSGSKVVIACCGDKKRDLDVTLPDNFTLPNGFSNPVFFQKGILMINAPRYTSQVLGTAQAHEIATHLLRFNLDHVAMIVLCDDSTFAAQTVNNFVWVTFTRANPSHDIYGIGSFVEHKHWGCKGALIVDSRIKPHHAPVLETDPDVEKRVRELLGKENYKNKK